MLLQISEPSQPSLPSVDAATFSVGIDLGTTLSAVAVLENDVPRVLDLPEGRLIPSAVFLSSEGAVTVGHQALARQGQAGELILSIKRLMGTPHRHTFSSAHGEKTWRPAEISAEILKHLKSQAEEVLGGKIKNAVITVPAYFDEAARTATKQAAHLAGLHVLRLLSEPTAAALAYGLDHTPKGAYAVYDLGGGTFDVSILRPHTGVLQVIATAGNTALGGDDFDERLYALLKTRDHTPIPPFSSSLQLISRQIKEKLSTQDTVDYSFSHDDIAFKGSVTRQSFEAAIAPLVDQTLAVAAQALRDAAISPLEISQIVLVGGSSRIPFVQQQVEAFFKKPPLCALNPDEAVALGAGLQAAALTQGSQTLLLDVIPISLGIETMGGLVEKIVHRNTAIPTVQEQDFTTYQDGQTALLIHVVQGEREFAAHCRSIARFTLSGIPPLAAGCAHIRVTFAVDADGLLTVTAQETKTGVSQRVEVQPTYGLTEDDMMRLLAEGMRHAQDDMALRKLAEAQVDARRLIKALEGALDQDGHLLKADVRAALVASVRILAQATHGHDSAEIRKQMKKVEHLTQAFAETRINQAMGKALTGRTIDTVSSAMKKIGSESDWQDEKSQV